MEQAVLDKLLLSAPYAGSIVGLGIVLHPVLIPLGAWLSARVAARDASEADARKFVQGLVTDGLAKQNESLTKLAEAVNRLGEAVRGMEGRHGA